MRTLIVKETDWHFRFLKMLDRDALKRTDICSYLHGLSEALMLSLFIAAVCGGFAFAAFYVIGDFLGWCAACVAYRGWIELGVGASAVLDLFIIATLIVVYTLAKVRAQKSEFLAAAADSIGSKICFPVRVE